MQELKFPLKFSFKITTLSNDFSAYDNSGRMVAYVRQKMFKFKEDIEIFSDESRSNKLYAIKADRWLDFSAAYSFYDDRGKEFGKIVRKGWKSLWKSEYEIIDGRGQKQFQIREENGWVKVMDGLLGEIPILGLISGYIFNPSYLVKNIRGEAVIRIKKDPSFWGKEFSINKLGNMEGEDDDRILLGLMMMILLERRRG